MLLKVDADGPNWTDTEAAEAFGIRANTVRDIRQRFVEEGLDAALDRKRRAEPPTPRKLDGAGEARLIAWRAESHRKAERVGRCSFWRGSSWSWRSSMASRTRPSAER